MKIKAGKYVLCTTYVWVADELCNLRRIAGERVGCEEITPTSAAGLRYKTARLHAAVARRQLRISSPERARWDGKIQERRAQKKN